MCGASELSSYPPISTSEPICGILGTLVRVYHLKIDLIWYPLVK